MCLQEVIMLFFFFVSFFLVYSRLSCVCVVIGATCNAYSSSMWTRATIEVHHFFSEMFQNLGA